MATWRAFTPTTDTVPADSFVEYARDPSCRKPTARNRRPTSMRPIGRPVAASRMVWVTGETDNVAYFKEVRRKFERWLALVFVQRFV